MAGRINKPGPIVLRKAIMSSSNVPSSDPSFADYRPKRLFTVEQANAVLPLVRAICTDLAQLSREVIERRDRVALLSAGRPSKSPDLYSEELVQIEEELEKDGQRL